MAPESAIVKPRSDGAAAYPNKVFIESHWIEGSFSFEVLHHGFIFQILIYILKKYDSLLYIIYNLNNMYKLHFALKIQG
jgi:hypothetical protein